MPTRICGYALSRATDAIPDVDLEKFGKKKFSADRIMQASPLPVLIDIDRSAWTGIVKTP